MTFLPAPSLPPGRPRLVLTGMMGAGKTEAGIRAAALLGLPFVDLDDVAVRRAGIPVLEIFARHGEPGFRTIERSIVEDMARLSGTVVATGGGGVLHRDAFAALADGAEVAVLAADLDELERRIIGDDPRPLIGDRPGEVIHKLVAERAELYAAAGERFDTTGLTPDEVARELAARYARRAGPAPGPGPGHPVRVEVHATGGQGGYPVLIGEGALESLGREVACLSGERPAAVVVADETADSFVGDRVSDSLAVAGVRSASRITLPPGERAKTLDTIGTLWTRFREAGLERTGVVVAVGGGAALDAAGFAAATFGRGVALANVPTTLLAMVDASLGGKVGIDHAGVKNLAGSFHSPSLVIADTSTMQTLPPLTLRAGLAECVKAAVLASPVMIDVLEKMPLGAEGTPADLTWIVEQSVRVKAGYVAVDPFDRSLRQALNLGHTFAHAIEAATGYGVPHGEAVAAGLVAAARLGEALGVTPGRLAGRLTALLQRLGLPTRPPEGLDATRVAEAMAADKKRRSGEMVVVVPAEGGAELVRGLQQKDLASALVDAA